MTDDGANSRVEDLEIEALCRDVQKTIEGAAAEIRTMDRAFIEGRDGPVYARTFVNGLVKAEGGAIVYWGDTAKDVAAATVAQLLPLVRGKILYWRVKPEIKRQRVAKDVWGPDRAREHVVEDDRWYCRVRVGLEDPAKISAA